MFLKIIIKNALALITLRQKGIPILMYHSIADNNVFFTVKPNMFEKQMRYLKDNNYNIIKFSKLVDILESDEELPKKQLF